jgi:cold shock CspA family protein
MQGTVKFWSSAKGFGFVKLDAGDGSREQVMFFAADALWGREVGEGDRVEVEYRDTPRGRRATKVTEL